MASSLTLPIPQDGKDLTGRSAITNLPDGVHNVMGFRKADHKAERLETRQAPGLVFRRQN